jgi:GT2 family glycosyltransferase
VYWARVASPNPSQTEVAYRAPAKESIAPSLRLVGPTGGFSAGLLRRFWLAMLVHTDAFRFDPFGYAQALFWRLRGLRLRSRNRLAALMGRSPRAYSLWIARVEPRTRVELLRSAVPSLPAILPVVDGAAPEPSVAETLRSLANASAGLTPIVVGGQPMPGTVHIEAPSDLAGFVGVAGTWLCIAPAGDRLAADAFEIYAKSAARAADSSVIYADDDIFDAGKRRHPHFKCSWNPDLFEHHDFITGAAILRVTPDMLADLDRGNWVEKLTQRAIQREAAPVHLPAVLHHRKQRPQPAAPTKPLPVLSGEGPSVSVIIPTRNRLAYLRTCIEGVRRTAYPTLDLVVVDNDSDDPEALQYLDELSRNGVKVLQVGGAFNFSALNNFAVKHADGELLCFLNNDVEIVDPDWLSLLVRQALRADLGAVGGRLLYPDGSLQHAGVVTGVGGGAAHAHRFLRDGDAGYFSRDRLPQRVSAVTAACLVVSKDKFLAVDGFNEQDFPVAFNDVDLCLKLNARGWQSFYEPRATLIHHESKSRGSDSAKENRVRFAAELAALKRHWGTDRQRDPFHHRHLSPFCEQFHIAV